MKTRFILGLCLAFIAGGLFSYMDIDKAEKLANNDKYKVIRVDGRIIFKRTSTDMKKGDIFLPGTSLTFKTPQSRAAVISSLKGRFVLSPSEKGQTKILPATNNISSRSGALINLLDLQKHFEGKYLIIEEMKLEIGKQNFQMDDKHFFYLSYEHNEETILKKLEHTEDNKLIVSKTELFKIDGEAIPVEEKEMTLYYRRGDSSEKINSFHPVFPDLTELEDEVQIILDEFSDKDYAEKVKEITAYLSEFYGKPNKENLGDWLANSFNLNP